MDQSEGSKSQKGAIKIKCFNPKNRSTPGFAKSFNFMIDYSGF